MRDRLRSDAAMLIADSARSCWTSCSSEDSSRLRRVRMAAISASLCRTAVFARDSPADNSSCVRAKSASSNCRSSARVSTASPRSTSERTRACSCVIRAICSSKAASWATRVVASRLAWRIRRSPASTSSLKRRRRRSIRTCSRSSTSASAGSASVALRSNSSTPVSSARTRASWAARSTARRLSTVRSLCVSITTSPSAPASGRR